MKLTSYSKPKDYADEMFIPFEDNIDVSNSNSYKGFNEPTPFAFVTPSFQTEVLDGEYDYYNHFNGTFYNILHRERENSKANSQSIPTDDKKNLKEVILEHNGKRIILEVEGDPFQTIHDAFNQTYNPDHLENTEIGDTLAQYKQPIEEHHIQNVDTINKDQTKDPIEMHRDYDEITRGPTTTKLQAYNLNNLKEEVGNRQPIAMHQDYDENTRKPTLSQTYNSESFENRDLIEQKKKKTKEKVENEESTAHSLNEDSFTMSSTQEESATASPTMQGSQTLKQCF